MRSCSTPYMDSVTAAATAIVANVILIPDTDYVWEITDQFSNVYMLPFTTDANGKGTIDVTELPEGFLNAAMGRFTVRVKESAEACDYVPLLMARNYPEICIDVVNSNLEKNHVGCSFPILFAPINGSFYYGSKDTADLPTAEEILDLTAQEIPAGGAMVITFSSEEEGDKYLVFAYPDELDDPTTYDINSLGSGPLGPDSPFALPVTVGGHRVIMSNYPLTIPTSVTFS